MSLPNTMKACVIQGKEVVVKENVPLAPLPEGNIMIKVQAAAGNPTDWKHVAYGIGPQGSISGCDVAGKIVKLGANVSRFQVGDEVFGVVHGASVKHPENGGFAEYSVLDSKMVLRVPNTAKISGQEHIPAGPLNSIETAASLPISLYTAGLILVLRLGLKMKWLPSQPQNDFPLMIWGGTTALGQLLIQLASKMNGYTKIVVVASRKHESYLKNLGADDLFDYHDSDVIEQIKSKYNSFVHLVDAVGTPESFTETYKLGSKDQPVTLVQVTTVNEDLIKPQDRNPNITVIGMLLYLISGTDLPFGKFTFPASPEMRDAMIQFLQFIEPKLLNGEIKHLPIQTFKGLESVPTMLKNIQHGKNANLKYVVTI